MTMELLFGNSINDMTILGVKWLIPLMIIFISIIVVTRNTKEMRLLFFPMTVGYGISGLPVGKLLLITSGIMFSVEVFGFSSIGSMIRMTGEGISDLTTRTMGTGHAIGRGIRKAPLKTGSFITKGLKKEMTNNPKLIARKKAKQNILNQKIGQELYKKGALKGQLKQDNAEFIINYENEMEKKKNRNQNIKNYLLTKLRETQEDKLRRSTKGKENRTNIINWIKEQKPKNKRKKRKEEKGQTPYEWSTEKDGYIER